MIYMFKLWPSAILPPLMCGLLWGKISPYAGAPAVIAGGLSFFLWSDKVLGEPFGIPANFIGIGMNCLVLFFVHQKMKAHKPEAPSSPTSTNRRRRHHVASTDEIPVLSVFLPEYPSAACGCSSASSSGSGI